MIVACFSALTTDSKIYNYISESVRYVNICSTLVALIWNLKLAKHYFWIK